MPFDLWLYVEHLFWQCTCRTSHLRFCMCNCIPALYTVYMLGLKGILSSVAPDVVVFPCCFFSTLSKQEGHLSIWSSCNASWTSQLQLLAVQGHLNFPRSPLSVAACRCAPCSTEPFGTFLNQDCSAFELNFDFKFIVQIQKSNIC